MERMYIHSRLYISSSDLYLVVTVWNIIFMISKRQLLFGKTGGRMSTGTEKKNAGITPVGVFMIFAAVNIIILITALVYTRGQFLSEVVWDARNNLFADFKSHIARVRGGRNPYVVEDWDARFPAFAYMFYYFLSCIIPEQIKNSNVSDWFNMYMVIIICICVVCICETVSRTLERSFAFTLSFMLIFILSHAFALAEVKAANSAAYVLTLLVMALYLRDTDSRIGREAALILIAAAAGFKVAPAIFGFLYIKEKRYKEAVRLIIYGIVFFFAPFAMFGGIEGLKNFMNITGQVSSAAIPRPETIGGVVIELFSVLGPGEEMGLKVGRVICFGYLAVCLYLFFKRKYSWKTLCLISSLMIIFVNLSYPYTLQYFLLPLIAFAKETRTDHNKLDYVYAVLFALIFTTYPFIRIDWPTATFITNYFFVYLFIFILLADVIKSSENDIEC